MSLTLRIGTLSMATAMLLVAPLLAAQEKGKDKPVQDDKPVATKPATPPAATRPASAAIQQKVTFPVTGLTADNVAKVQTALGGVSHTAWTCPDCKMSADQKGTCVACKKDLVSQAHKCLSDVKADAATGQVTANLNSGAQLKLSELERALGGASAKLDTAKLTLSGNTQLIVQGPGTADAAKKFEEGLKTAKLFESVEIKHEGDSRDYVINARTGSNAPTQAAVASAITKAGEGFKLVDVVWIAPKQVS